MLEQPTRHPDDTDADLPPQPPLSPCPWCGATPRLLDGLHHGYYVSCQAASCPVVPPETRPADTIEQAARVWNTRAGEAAQLTEAGRLAGQEVLDLVGEVLQAHHVKILSQMCVRDTVDEGLLLGTIAEDIIKAIEARACPLTH